MVNYHAELMNLSDESEDWKAADGAFEGNWSDV